MYKQILTLFRGRAHDSAEHFIDQNALSILKQQIRDAAASIQSSRQAIAVAMAGHQQELGYCEKLTAQIDDLETRATAALESNKMDMVQEAAEAIAALEDEVASSRKAQDRFNKEIIRLKSQVRTAQIKLRDLQRGERLATATNRTQKLHAVSPVTSNSSLRDAEATLARLEEKQQGIEFARNTERELETCTAPTNIAERMAAEGLGAPLKSSADAVLERLRAKQNNPKTKRQK